MKTYIAVPYSEKDQAKRLGARFDMSNKSWYVPDGIDLMKFKRWLPNDLNKYWQKLEKKVESQ